MAFNLGRELAQRKAIVLTGGKGPDDSGVKGAALRGAEAKASPWIGVIRKGKSRAFLTGRGLVIDTDLKHRRNILEAYLCDGAICLDGDKGTISEAMFSLAFQRPVVFVGSEWQARLPRLRGFVGQTVELLKSSTREDAFLDKSMAALGPHECLVGETEIEVVVKILQLIGDSRPGSFQPVPEDVLVSENFLDQWLAEV